MLLSNACEYGIRACIYMAMKTGEQLISIGDMSKKLNISFHFLTKTLQLLTRANILNSHRGPYGGLSFKRDPENITLMDIVLSIDGDGIFKDCIIGISGCSDDNPCPLHESWGVQRSAIEKTFRNTTLKKIADKIKKNNNLVLTRSLETQLNAI